MKINSEQHGYHADKYCLRGCFMSFSRKIDWIFLGLFFLFMSACGNERVHDEPLVSTVEIQVFDNFSFYYLPRILSVINESIVFLNIESNCLSVYSTRNGIPITHFTIDDLEIDNIYSEIIDHLDDSSILSYEQIRKEELFRSRVKISTFIKQDLNSFICIITVPYLSLSEFEYNGEIMDAKVWRSEYAAIELKFIGSGFIVEEVRLIAAHNLPENTGLNFKSSFASNRKSSILLPLSSIVRNGDSLYTFAEFRKRGKLYVLENLFKAPMEDFTNNFLNDSLMQVDIWPIDNSSGKFLSAGNVYLMDSIASPTGTYSDTQHFSHAIAHNNDLWGIKGDLYGKYFGWKDSVCISYSGECVFKHNIRTVSGLAYNTGKCYFFTRSEDDKIFLNSFEL